MTYQNLKTFTYAFQKNFGLLMPWCVIALASLFLLPNQVIWYPPECHPLIPTHAVLSGSSSLPRLNSMNSPVPVPLHEGQLPLLHCPSPSFLKNHYPYMEVFQSVKLSTTSVISTRLQPCNCRPTSGYSYLFLMRYFTGAQSWGLHRNWRCQSKTQCWPLCVHW